MIKIRLLFFATMKDRAGQSQVDIELPDGATVADLKKYTGKLFPALEPYLAHALVAVNQSYAFPEDPLPDQAEAAFFPPVSGGADDTGGDGDTGGADDTGGGKSTEDGFPTILRVSNEPLDLNDLLLKITLPSTGAAAIFTGMVRGVTSRGSAHETIYLEYEAYVPMAEAKMAQVAKEIRERWPTVEGVAMVQRIGKLDAGTPTVLIACTAAHRDTGVFEAARYGIDRLKEIVPVWKKEVKPDGEEWVEGDYHPERGD